MVEWESGMPLGANIFVANGVFKCDMLRILLLQFHEGLEEHTLGTKERSSASAMSLVIMGAAPRRGNDFVA